MGDVTEHVGSGSELWLNNLTLSDSAMYSCMASNTQGSVTAHATVTVTGQLCHSHTHTHTALCLGLPG